MAKRKKETKRRGLFGIFGKKDGEEGEEGEQPPAPQASQSPADPGPQGEEDVWHKPPEHSGETGHVQFGSGRVPQQGDGDLFDFNQPDPLLGQDPAELTMAPGYAQPGGMDPSQLTVPPNYRPGAGGGAADPFDFDPGELTMAPGYAQAGGVQPPQPGFDPSDLTMAPGYATGGPAAAGGAGGAGATPGSPATPVGGPRPIDPFAEAGEMTMAPGYATGGGRSPSKGGPPQPGGNPFADMTIAPGYAGGSPAGPTGAAPGKPSPNPFELDSGELTMAPGYATGQGGAVPGPGGPGRDNPFGGAGDLTMAPGYAQPGGPGSPAQPGADPFDFDPSDLTLAPGYADPASGQPGRPGSGPGAGDLTMAPGYAQPGQAGGAGAGDLTMAPGYAHQGLEAPSPGARGPIPEPELDSAGLMFDPEGPTLQGPTTPRSGELPGDAFGSEVMADPFGQATPPPAAQGEVGRTAQLQEDADFRAERTVVDLSEDDIAALADLAATDDHLAIPSQVSPLQGRRPAGAGLSVGGPGLSPRPPAARQLFAQIRPDGQGGVVCRQPSSGVTIDAERGLLFAPPAPGGWANVPAALLQLDDGTVLGRVQAVDATTVCLPAAPEGDSITLRLPEDAKVDPRTRAVLIPAGSEDDLSWRPPHTARTEAGLLFFLPPEAERADDGSWSFPAPATSTSVASRRHGAVVERWSYFGVVEHVHADGWTRVELPEGAEVSEGTLAIPAEHRWRGSPPPLLRWRIDASGRVLIEWPSGVRQEGPEVWVAPVRADADHPPLLVELSGEATEVRDYLGLRDELLADGSIRLHLPEGATVRDGWLHVPAEYACVGDAEVLLEFERADDGSFRFQLPEQALPLGSVILIPADGATPTAVEASSPAPARERDKGSQTTRVKALDRFRGGKTPKDDTVTFDGVLKSETGADADAADQDSDAADQDSDAADADSDVGDADSDAGDSDAGDMDAGDGDSDAGDADSDAADSDSDSDSADTAAKSTGKASKRRSRRKKKKG